MNSTQLQQGSLRPRFGMSGQMLAGRCICCLVIVGVVFAIVGAVACANAYKFSDHHGHDVPNPPKIAGIIMLTVGFALLGSGIAFIIVAQRSSGTNRLVNPPGHMPGPVMAGAYPTSPTPSAPSSYPQPYPGGPNFPPSYPAQAPLNPDYPPAYPQLPLPPQGGYPPQYQGYSPVPKEGL